MVATVGPALAPGQEDGHLEGLVALAKALLQLLVTPKNTRIGGLESLGEDPF